MAELSSEPRTARRVTGLSILLYCVVIPSERPAAQATIARTRGCKPHHNVAARVTTKARPLWLLPSTARSEANPPPFLYHAMATPNPFGHLLAKRVCVDERGGPKSANAGRVTHPEDPGRPRTFYSYCTCARRSFASPRSPSRWTRSLCLSLPPWCASVRRHRPT